MLELQFLKYAMLWINLFHNIFGKCKAKKIKQIKDIRI